MLYIEPKWKEITAKTENLKFSLQLANEKSGRKGPVLEMQGRLRSLLSALKDVEKSQYQVRNALAASDDREQMAL